MLKYSLVAVINKKGSGELTIVAPLKALYNTESEAVTAFLEDECVVQLFMVYDNAFYDGTFAASITTYSELCRVFSNINWEKFHNEITTELLVFDTTR